jgi:hypothetical protein
MENAVLHSIHPLLRQSGCASWTLYLDKLGFERNGDAEAKTTALKKAKSIYGNQKDRLRECRRAFYYQIKNLSCGFKLYDVYQIFKII